MVEIKKYKLKENQCFKLPRNLQKYVEFEKLTIFHTKIT